MSDVLTTNLIQALPWMNSIVITYTTLWNFQSWYDVLSGGHKKSVFNLETEGNFRIMVF